MELLIAGGVGEHGRNCFYVQAKTLCFLVDCGKGHYLFGGLRHYGRDGGRSLPPLIQCTD